MADSFNILPGTDGAPGAHTEAEGTHFRLFSAHADKVELCLFSPDGKTELQRLPLPDQTGGLWHGFVPGLKAGQLYGYRVHGPYAPTEGHRFNAHKLLLDPYARALHGDFVFNDALFGYDRADARADLSFDGRDSAPFMPKCVVTDPDAPYGGAPAPHIRAQDTILYEAHVRGLTMRHDGVPKKLRGTVAGLAAPKMLDHLTKLGATSIELLPVMQAFPEPRLTEMGLTNYWGYNTIGFFVPDARLMGGEAALSFRDMVSAYHKAGLEVILDVVYNHTAESWELGPTLSFRGIDNMSYYRLQDDARFYKNETGCGNSLNLAHPRVLALVMDSLRYWVTVMGVDGFRFDLATTLARNPDDYEPHAGFLAAIQQDPVLMGVKLIAEPWDIGPGGYRLGQFPPRFGEWNDRYRDTVRRFWRGDQHQLPDLGARLMGSADLFDHGGRAASSSVNFITSHDGFTLEDTVAYAHKHNDANGEQNRDGHSENYSANLGHEGPTDDANIVAARGLRKRALLATLMVSQGTPMLLAGDEIGHSQQGNNNAYCQDNDITWLDWAAADEDLTAFTRALIAFRKAHPVLSRPKFLHGAEVSSLGVQDVSWVGPDGRAMAGHAWQDPDNHVIGLLLCGQAGDYRTQNGTPERDETLLIVFNAGKKAVSFTLPDLPAAEAWRQCLDTATADFTVGAPIAAGAAHKVAAQSVGIFTCTYEDGGSVEQQELLMKLASLYGIEPGYFSFEGQYHSMSHASRQALLAALGVPVTDEAALQAHLDAREAAAHAPLPATLVARAGEKSLPVKLQDGTDVHWTITLEGGSKAEGHGTVEGGTLRLDLPDTPGYHRLTLGDHSAALIIAPRCALDADTRHWGITAPLYGLTSNRNWGVGDFADLAVLAEQAAAQGAAFIGLNPVHALFPSTAALYSPYSPSSRKFLNVLHIAPDMIPELTDSAEGQAFLAAMGQDDRLRGARDAEFVDYAAALTLKREAFEKAFSLFPASKGRKAAFSAFVKAGGTALYRHALYEALAEHFGAKDAAATHDWQAWPADYQDCTSEAVAAFAKKDKARIDFYLYLQWLAAEQLAAAQARAKAAGMAIGLYLDLAVGTVPGGSETWAEPDAVIRGVGLGAPGDTANPDGQNWNLAPFNPDALKRTAYAPFAEMLRASMSVGGMVRVDHILGINRSFLCPAAAGIPGGYVRFPKDDLLGVIALESHRTGALVIGEDLGTVPEGFRDTLKASGLMGCRIAFFERRQDGPLKRAQEYDAASLASLTNHDLPTVRGFWQGEDFKWREALGIGADPEKLAHDKAARARDRHDLLMLLKDEGLLPDGLNPDHSPEEMSEPLATALHAFLARTASRLVAVQLEDILDLVGQPNVPGTTDEQPNWRRKLPVTVDDIFAGSARTPLIDAINRERPPR
ncbi:glycogen debranching protein GlgX [Kordiimonas marina]|uniref:glycogen debranching protein GlgX n=1 Tax=Kordiimonas marina TaxID=2872312 RepID=UPI001FF64DB5|nr:glycogen debranching protein GlgX [Kordiimonas marina]